MGAMTRRGWPVLLGVVLSLPLTSCYGDRTALIGAILTSAIAVGAAVDRRAEGECYVPCNFGTICNPSTGYCDPLPCRGACAPNEICVVNGDQEQCQPMPTPDLYLQGRSQAPPAPFSDLPEDAPAPPPNPAPAP
jgi:hypothetical protein